MIYKEISLSAALQMVVEDDLKNLFFENNDGLCAVTEIRFSLVNMKSYKWFKRTPKEAELG